MMRNVIYFGDRVKPGEKDRILMRWRLDNGRYRVIYGDLRADTVDGDEILNLESH
jgi:hypothetical protein